MNLLKRYYMVVLTSVFFLCCSTTCEIEQPESMYFYVANRDIDTIFVYHDWKIDDEKGVADKDVSVRDMLNMYSPFDTLPPGNMRRDFYMGVPEGELNKHFKYKDKDKTYSYKHYIFIFRKETMMNYSREELIEQNIYDAIYVLKSKDILDMDYIVPYPMENMSDVAQE